MGWEKVQTEWDTLRLRWVREMRMNPMGMKWRLHCGVETETFTYFRLGWLDRNARKRKVKVKHLGNVVHNWWMEEKKEKVNPAHRQLNWTKPTKPTQKTNLF